MVCHPRNLIATLKNHLVNLSNEEAGKLTTGHSKLLLNNSSMATPTYRRNAFLPVSRIYVSTYLTGLAVNMQI
jgi:hypothetical protein